MGLAHTWGVPTLYRYESHQVGNYDVAQIIGILILGTTMQAHDQPTHAKSIWDFGHHGPKCKLWNILDSQICKVLL